MLYYTEVHWLSRGSVLKRFFELRAEVKDFMERHGVAVPVLSDPKWLMDLAFFVDITHDLDVLNKKLQGQVSVLPMTMSEHSAQNSCYGKPSSLKQTFAISQHARHSWMQVYHSVVRSMLRPF